MKYLISFLLCFLPLNIIFCQDINSDNYNEIDTRALQMPDSDAQNTDLMANFIKKNFKTDEDKTRAIFIWIAANISYDAEKRYAINIREQQENSSDKLLKTRKGVCGDYASLFQDLCKKTGIKSFIIQGYTKTNDCMNFLPHAWNAALINDSWFLYDATWGAGYLDNNTFIRKINNLYYKVPPADFINSHMPFDYLWQFLNYPVTNLEFQDSKIPQEGSRPFFNYKDTLVIYEKLIPEDQLKATANRIDKNGVTNTIVILKRYELELNIQANENNKQNNESKKMADLFNAASDQFSQSVALFNEFVYFKNAQFLPPKPDADIQKMIDMASNKLNESKKKLSLVTTNDPNIKTNKANLSNEINKLSGRVKEEQNWLNTYFSKKTEERKMMFLKRIKN